MVQRKYISKIARVVRVCHKGDFPFFVRVQGRRIAAEAFYRGSEAYMNEGDPVIILDCRDIAVLIAPINNDVFYETFHAHSA